MTNSHGEFIWYELMTPDPDGAKVFYDAVVGWNIGSEPALLPEGEAPATDYRMIGRADGGFAGGVLKLTPDMLGHGAQPGWYGYIRVDDVDATADAITARGGSILMPPMTLESVGRMAMVADPQGVPFYVMRGASNERSDVFSLDGFGRVGWNELMTDNLDAALHFYGQLFGYVVHERMDMGEFGPYCLLDHHGMRIGAAMQARPESPRIWQFYFSVDSITRAIAEIEKGRGKVLMGPHQVPTGDWIVIGLDPQGSSFALVGAKGD